MFRAKGGDLQTVLDTEEFLQEHVCTDILRDTLQGLKFLHTHSIAHLDIKVKLGFWLNINVICDKNTTIISIAAAQYWISVFYVFWLFESQYCALCYMFSFFIYVASEFGGHRPITWGSREAVWFWFESSPLTCNGG